MQLTKEETKYIYSKPKGHYIRLYQLGKKKGISNEVIKKYYHENIKQHIPKSAPKPKGVPKATQGGGGLDALQQIIANLGRNVSEAIHPDSQTGSNINTLFTTFADAYGNRGKKGKGGAIGTVPKGCTMTKAKILKICGEFCPDGPNQDTNKLDGMKTLVGHMVENGMMDEKDLKKHHNKVLRNLSKRKNGATMDDYTHLMAKKALVEPKGAGGNGGGINMPLFKSIMNILMPVDPLGIKKAVGLGFHAGGGINMPLFKSIMQILMPVDPLGIKKAVGLGFGDTPPSYESLFPDSNKKYKPPKIKNDKPFFSPPPYSHIDSKYPTLGRIKNNLSDIADSTKLNLKNGAEVVKNRFTSSAPFKALSNVYHKVFGRGDLDKEMLKQLHHHSLKHSMAGSRGGAFKKAFFTEAKKHINHPFLHDLEMLSKHTGRNLALDYADHALKTDNVPKGTAPPGGGAFFNRKDKLNNTVQQSQNLANSANDFLSAATRLATRNKGPSHPNGAVAFGTPINSSKPDMNTSGVYTPNVSSEGKISGFKKASNWFENKGNQFQKSVESTKPYQFVNNAFTKLFGRGLSDDEIHGIHQHALTSASKGPSYKHDFMEQVREVFNHPFIHELADASKNSNINLMIHYAQIILETLAKMEQVQPPGGNMFYLEPQFLADVEKLSNED